MFLAGLIWFDVIIISGSKTWHTKLWIKWLKPNDMSFINRFYHLQKYSWKK